jgi:mannitol/fructose-specific phosphotransferase system IIA component (Ntr-type)
MRPSIPSFGAHDHPQPRRLPARRRTTRPWNRGPVRRRGTGIASARGVLPCRRSDYVPDPLLRRRSVLHSSSWNDTRILKTMAIPHAATLDVYRDGNPSTLARVARDDSGSLATNTSVRHASPTTRTNSCVREVSAGMDVLLDLEVAARRQVLEVMAMRIATMHGLNPELVFRALWRREQVASTAIGHCIAQPHARVGGIDQPFFCSPAPVSRLSSARRMANPHRSSWPSSFRGTRAMIIYNFSLWR